MYFYAEIYQYSLVYIGYFVIIYDSNRVTCGNMCINFTHVLGESSYAKRRFDQCLQHLCLDIALSLLERTLIALPSK